MVLYDLEKFWLLRWAKTNFNEFKIFLQAKFVDFYEF